MWQYFERLFPVIIDVKAGVLRVHDRRPSEGLLLSVFIMTGSLLVSAMIFRSTLDAGIYWLPALVILPAPIFAVRSLILPIRAVHVFDKGQNLYRLSCRTALRSKSTQGDLSEIRAVHIERRVITSVEHTDSREIYRAVLLLHNSLLLGASDTVPLREEEPLGSSYDIEAQIARSIANYLELRVPEVIEM